MQQCLSSTCKIQEIFPSDSRASNQTHTPCKTKAAMYKTELLFSFQPSQLMYSYSKAHQHIQTLRIHKYTTVNKRALIQQIHLYQVIPIIIQHTRSQTRLVQALVFSGNQSLHLHAHMQSVNKAMYSQGCQNFHSTPLNLLLLGTVFFFRQVTLTTQYIFASHGMLKFCYF